MANTLITPTVVAKLALPALLNNWVFAGLVHRDYAKEFRKVGESVRIRRPAVLTAVEFDGDLEGEWQNIAESYVDVKMDTILTVPIEFTQKEQSLDIVSFNTQVVEPAVQALAQKVDEKLALLYKDIPYYYDITETNAASILASLLGARKVQNDLKVPFSQSRYAVMSPLTTALLLGVDAFRDLDKTGATKALREASLGRLFGYEFYENQNIQHHTRGTTDGLGTAAIAAVGATSMLISALGSGTVKKGTMFTIAGDTTQYVVTADATISGNAATVSFYPALVVATTAGTEVVTLHGPDATDELATSRDNLMFHKNAFVLVTAPMAPPIGGATGRTLNYKGLTINVVYSYQHSKFQNRMTASILCGFKTLTRELAVRLWDAS